MSHARETIFTAARVLLGAGFLLFGLNGLLQFLPQPDVPSEAGAFLGALAATGYMFPLIKWTEIVAGAMLLAGYRAPLALTLLAPILVNILFYHAALDPAGILPGLVLTVLELVVVYRYREAFAPLIGKHAVTGVRWRRSAETTA
jgi:uncharacterized membrane protein YphA (DoxX/SURF4 family)